MHGSVYGLQRIGNFHFFFFKFIVGVIEVFFVFIFIIDGVI